MAAKGMGEQPCTAADGDKGGRQKWLRRGQREADGDVCSLFWGAKIGDFWEICKRMGEKMRKIVYFVYLSRGYVGVEIGHRSMDYLDNLTIWNDKMLNNLFNLTIID